MSQTTTKRRAVCAVAGLALVVSAIGVAGSTAAGAASGPAVSANKSAKITYAAWSSSTQYAKGALVSYSGLDYQALKKNKNKKPSNESYWRLVVPGANGSNGSNGNNGSDGTNGAAGATGATGSISTNANILANTLTTTAGIASGTTISATGAITAGSSIGATTGLSAGTTVTAGTGLIVGASSPTTITNIRVISSGAITPAASAATISAFEQTFTFTGIATTDKVFVTASVAPTALCPMTGARVTATDTIALQFSTMTAVACTPAAGTYTAVAIRS